MPLSTEARRLLSLVRKRKKLVSKLDSEHMSNTAHAVLRTRVKELITQFGEGVEQFAKRTKRAKRKVLSMLERRSR